MLPLRRLAGSLTLAAVLLGTAGALAGCGGGGGGTPDPKQALTQAKKHLDDTSGVHFTLTSDNLPKGVTTLSKADGTLTRAPAFKGTITVPIGGFGDASIAVVAVGGAVYAKIPLTTGYQKINPADYGVPDPATLLDPDTGISSLLSATDHVKKGGSVRGGKDNRSVLTEYSGTVPGKAVAAVIPGSAGTFEATYTIDDAGLLSKAVLTGHFHGDTVPPNTYTVSIDDYGTDEKITPP